MLSWPSESSASLLDWSHEQDRAQARMAASKSRATAARRRNFMLNRRGYRLSVVKVSQELGSPDW